MAMATSLLAGCEDKRLIGLAPNPIVVAACGRRFGKTKAAAAAALWNLLLVPELDLGGSEKRYAMSIANSQLQARLFVDHARSLVQASPTLRAELVSETVNELVFRRNRVLAAFPCTAKGIRGYAASFVCLDEFAHFYDIEEGGPAVASKIWAAVRPSVAQFGKQGRTVLISTPMGADNLFASLWQKADTGQIAGAAAFHAPTNRNPMIDSASSPPSRRHSAPTTSAASSAPSSSPAGAPSSTPRKSGRSPRIGRNCSLGMRRAGRWRSIRPAASVTRSRSRSSAMIPGDRRISSAVSSAAGFPSASAGSQAPNRRVGLPR
jgi:hypothetical protein